MNTTVDATIHFVKRLQISTKLISIKLQLVRVAMSLLFCSHASLLKVERLQPFLHFPTQCTDTPQSWLAPRLLMIHRRLTSYLFADQTTQRGSFLISLRCLDNSLLMKRTPITQALTRLMKLTMVQLFFALSLRPTAWLALVLATPLQIKN